MSLRISLFCPHELAEYCEPTLVIWLVEELLDSQTIQDCRKVFDYLESRRERIITVCKRWTLPTEIKWITMYDCAEALQIQKLGYSTGVQ